MEKENNASIETEIRDYVEGLAPDMNLELMCDIPVDDSGLVLWVEGISVTGITYPEPCRKSKIGRLLAAFTRFLRHLFHHNRG